ncbi:hypothetical protein B4U79_00103 [Dinothrombium tinctorium]|uniref:Uncharacterized protein n=1 Tax=Dinothrombium tinctorium TaxID=1965070 RepID=A0A443Q7J8_9ACAR|nr:hypothetical protein B4U79_00103 [Dinothrombium tinctorium]
MMIYFLLLIKNNSKYLLH